VNRSGGGWRVWLRQFVFISWLHFTFACSLFLGDFVSESITCLLLFSLGSLILILFVGSLLIVQVVYGTLVYIFEGKFFLLHVGCGVNFRLRMM